MAIYTEIQKTIHSVLDPQMFKGHLQNLSIHLMLETIYLSFKEPWLTKRELETIMPTSILEKNFSKAMALVLLMACLLGNLIWLKPFSASTIITNIIPGSKRLSVKPLSS